MKTPITYYGGKILMVKDILPLIPKHHLYCEPFIGGGAIFFAKPPSKVEVINDLDGHVINFYRVAKLRYQELEDEIKASLHSRDLHAEAKAIYGKPVGDSGSVLAAWALWYLAITSFGREIGGSYSYSRVKAVGPIFNNKKESFTDAIMRRLSCVEIENRDALKVIKSRDAEGSFFYLDPPYVGANMGHYKGYTDEDYLELLTLLSNLKGRFLLSSFPSDILADFTAKNKWEQIGISKQNCMAPKNGKKTEVLTANYKLSSAKIDNPLEI